MLRRVLLTLIAFALVSCWAENPPPAYRANRSPEVIARGRELVKGLAACGVCHGEAPNPSSILAGGRTFEDTYGAVEAANITPARSGLGDWKDEDIVRALRASLKPGDAWISGDLHRGYEWLSDEDALSIVSYLRTLPAVEKEVRHRDLSFMDRNTKGLFDSRYEVKGYVPAIDRKSLIEYGQYLTDHVARCGGCHNAPGTIFRGEQYLAGGRLIRNDLGEKVAPSISSSRVEGIGDWSEEAIISYLKTGIGPDGNATDPNFCPTGFYRNAAEKDLIAIARYLRTVPG